MIRVGFVINGSGNSWLGGVTYYRNLFGALAHSQSIEPVVLTGGGSPPEAIVTAYPHIQVITSAFINPTSVAYKARKATARLVDRDLIMERVLRRHDIDVLSHAGGLGRRAELPTLCWIPDFQHLHMPEFFEPREVAWRDRSYARQADAATRVILSSQSALADFATFRPGAAHKGRVLRFVAAVGDHYSTVEARETLMARLNLDRPYFHLPNQFWKHKNHSVVVEALALARSRGTPLCVVATGHTVDRRDPAYFDRLMERVRAAGCEADFRVLGVVPYADLAALMCHSVALINPSLFEGWSTTVEEAKSLGKTIVLSDIPVHREQAPKFGVYFDPHAPQDLLERMEQALGIWSPITDVERRTMARRNLPGRVTAFAAAYEALVLEALPSSVTRTAN